MLYPLNLLINNGASIKILGYIMACCSDQLYPSLEGLPIGIGSHKSRKKAMMDVDHASLVGRAKPPRNNLHEAGQHYELHRLLR